jgi:two-component system phosphate regulon sensor histidine kinase PhoR
LSDELNAQLDQLRERGDQLAAVLGGMVEGVIAVDRRARVMFANGAAGRQFDFRADQARGRPLLTLIRDETLHQSIRRAMDTGGVVNAEIQRYLPSSGALTVHATPLPGVPCPGVVLVLYDMTRLRRLESLRQEFVANVSHELKTPLSSIKAYAETLRAGAINDEKHNLEFVKRIEDQADRLHQLIMDLLSLARIESGQEAYEIEDVDVQEAVESCLANYQPSADAKQIQLVTDPPAEELVVRADDEALRQILDNLVNNAVKYVPASGRVTVRWRRQNSDALIEVIDTGIGIEEAHLDRIFERFYRVDKARSRELGGTGLGLSIVKHLAQFFGGTVGVNSEFGKGSTFWVRLPLAES